MNKTIIKEYEFLNAAKESIFFRTPFELFKDPLLRKLIMLLELPKNIHIEYAPDLESNK